MSSFLQSPEWQEIQERMGRRTERIGGVLLIRHDLPFGFHYLYAPRLRAITSDVIPSLEAFARSSGALFLKADSEVACEFPMVPQAPGRSLQPQRTILITASADQALQAAFHPKTRYNIRVGERHGVFVRALPSAHAIRTLHELWPLFLETAARDGFHVHPFRHYETLFTVQSKDFENELWVADFGGVPAAAAIINWYYPSGQATYLHGASSREYRSVMAPHVLHWRILQTLQGRNVKIYDFGGIDEELWPGVTRFKMGFGGVLHTFPSTFDYVFRPPLYQLYRLQRKIRGGSV